MNLAGMQQRLLANVRARVRNGDLTERGLARLTGVSQPHLHNVLKGVRSLSTELADELLRELHIPATELMGEVIPNLGDAFAQVPLMAEALGCETAEFEPHRTSGAVACPEYIAAVAEQPLAIRLGIDTKTAPRFEAGDLVVVDRCPSVRKRIDRNATFIARTARGPRLRYVRYGGTRVYLPSEQGLTLPGAWESVPLRSGDLLEIVLARVVWISRHFHHARGRAGERPAGPAADS